MTEDIYTLAIVALLPLTVAMLVLQANPYHALVIRGIVGAVAALVYALFGAADVALTEALVGTMLSITLYAVAVRSSLVMRLGVLERDNQTALTELLAALRQSLKKCHLRLELVSYPGPEALQTALMEKEVHTICWLINPTDDSSPCQLQTRLQRLYDLMRSNLPTSTHLTYANPANLSQPQIQPLESQL